MAVDQARAAAAADWLHYLRRTRALTSADVAAAEGRRAMLHDERACGECEEVRGGKGRARWR